MNKEKIEEVVSGYKEALKKADIKEGAVYNADTTIKDENDKETKITACAFGIGRFKFSQFPHLECKLLNENLQEVINIVFMTDETAGEEIKELDLKNIRNDVIFDLAKVATFAKEIKINGIKKELYFNERKKVEEQLEAIDNMIKEFGIKED